MTGAELNKSLGHLLRRADAQVGYVAPMKRLRLIVWVQTPDRYTAEWLQPKRPEQNG
jgi:hypothetical protein